MALVYLAGPIQNVPLDMARGWRRAVTRGLMEHPFCVASVFDPAAGFTVHPTENSCVLEDVQEIDDLALRKSAVVVALRQRGVTSKGTDHEVRLAMRIPIPIVVYSLGYEAPSITNWLIGTGGVVVGSLSEQRLKIRFTVQSVVDTVVGLLK
jgi:hypothetical protein